MPQKTIKELKDQLRNELRLKSDSKISSYMECFPRISNRMSDITVMVRIYGPPPVLAIVKPVIEVANSPAFGQRELKKHGQNADSADYQLKIAARELPVGKPSLLVLRPSSAEDPIATATVTVYHESVILVGKHKIREILIEPFEAITKPRHWWQWLLAELGL